MALSDLQIAAALAERVYRRGILDQPIDLLNLGTNSATGLTPVGLVRDSTTDFYYNDSTGFVGSVVKINGTVFVTYRGTDNSGGFWDVAQSLASEYLGYISPSPRADGKDFSEGNSKLSSGTTVRSQLDDALALYEAAKQLVSNNEEIVVVGQSLGGGLAGLVSAIRDVRGIAIAPAPFAKQLAIEATFKALFESSAQVPRDTIHGWVASVPYMSTSITRDEAFSDGGNKLRNYLNLVDSGLSSAQIEGIITSREANIVSLQYNLEQNLEINTITGEALTSGLIGSLTPGIQFEVTQETNYDVGVTTGSVNVTESVALHGPSIHNLIIRTDSETQKFSELLKNDQTFRTVLLNTSAGAPLEHNRADPGGPSMQLAGGPNPAILYNALWKEVGQQNGLYDYFFKLFNDVMSKGAADTPQAPSGIGIHSGLVKLALGVLREGLTSGQVGGVPAATWTLAQAKDALGGQWDFGGAVSDGVPFADKVVIDKTRITATDERLLDKIGTESLQQAYGIRDIEAAVAKAFFDAIAPYGPNLGQIGVIHSVLGATQENIIDGSEELDRPWDIVVAQAGSDNGTLTYKPDETKITQPGPGRPATVYSDAAHVIFGGNADGGAGGAFKDDLTGSSKDDYIVGGDGKDRLAGRKGEDVLIGGKGKDTASYWDAANAIDAVAALDFSAARDQELLAGIIRMKTDGDGTTDANEDGFIDTLVSIERIELHKTGDNFVIQASNPLWDGAQKLPEGLTIDGGHGAATDKLDFSQLATPIFLSSATTGENAVEVYGLYEQQTVAVTGFLNRFWVQGDVTGRGFLAPSKLRFTGFEAIEGTAYSDRMDLRQLTPGGELTQAETLALKEILDEPLNVSLSDPNAVWNAFDAKVTAAQAVASQLGQSVVINGGGGNDIISAPQWGEVTINGGAGNDYLYGNGLSVTLNGGDGTDVLFGGSAMRSVLTGGAGTDIFSLGRNTRITDASTEDYVLWDSTWFLSGGVKQSWQEGAWAYSGSAYNLLSSIAPAIAGTGLSLAMQQWGPMLTYDLGLFRYGLSVTGQLIVQAAAGLAGQAVIDGYAKANGSIEDKQVANISVLQMQKTSGASLGEIKATIQAVLASAGIGTTGTDPLVLDLDGDGLELVRLEASQTRFDLDADGFAERTAWVKSDDGLLARDLNGNGKIDDISELFGDADTSGFTILDTLDDNNDNRIDAADAAFGSLKVWRDLNQNGVTDSGELQGLIEAGIASISTVGGTPTAAIVRGTTIRAEGSFTRTDGSTGTISDALLGVDQGDTVYLGDKTISAAAAALPELKGLGNVRDLRIAISHDAILLGLVDDFADLPSTTSWETLQSSAESILLRWSGADALAPIAMTGNFDRQKLGFLEAIAGRQLVLRDPNGQPDVTPVPQLIESWNMALDKATARLALQGPLAGVFAGISYDVVADGFQAANASSLADAFAAAFAALAADAPTAPARWEAIYAPALGAISDDLVRSDGNAVRSDYILQAILTAMDGASIPLSLTQIVSGLALPNVLIGTAAGETLTRNAPSSDMQVFVGGAGDDALKGGIGQDVYVFGAGFGTDTITDIDGRYATGDRIRFANLNADQVTISRVGNDLVITVNGTTDKVIVKDQYAPITRDIGGSPLSADRAIEEIQFKDGKILEAVDIAMAVGRGTSAGETLTGSSGKDMLAGLGGNDILRGGDDGDTYFYAIGDGADIVDDNAVTATVKAADALVLLSGISLEGLHFSRAGASSDLTITFGTVGDSVTLVDQFAYLPTGIATTYELDNRIEAFVLADGGSFNWLTLQEWVLETYVTAGDDQTYGYGTPDLLFASTGNDYLSGLDGGDTYHFDIGSGQDVIEDNQAFVDLPLFSGLLGTSFSQNDTLIFGAGISQADVTFKRLGAAADLTISIAGVADTLTIKEQFHGQPIDLFGLFGTQWFDRIELFKFADGSQLTWEDVLHRVTQGTSGADQLYGATYEDTLDGGTGDDYLSGGNEDDVYVYAQGYGFDVIEDKTDNYLTGTNDRVVFTDILKSQAVFSRSGNSPDLVITFPATSTDQLTIKGFFDVFDTALFGVNGASRIETLQWSDGSTTSWDEVVAEVVAASGTAGNDTIYGAYFGDVLAGGAGDDLLIGGDGSDTYLIEAGDGHDVVRDSQGSIFSGGDDEIVFGVGLDPNDVAVELYTDRRSARLVFQTIGQSVSIDEYFSYSAISFNPYSIERISFANGVIWTIDDVRARYLATLQTSGDDVVEGFQTNDTIAGGTGNDILRGNDGSDVYVFAPGFGQDILEENVLSVMFADNDRVEFAAGFDPSATILTRSLDDLIITWTGSSDQLTVKGQFGHSDWSPGLQDIETFSFGNGTIWTDVQVRAMVLSASITSGDDVVTGFFTADTIDGGTGNDTLKGLGGGDTYLFGRDSGNDVIQESFGTIFEDFPDTVKFAADILPTDVTFTRVGDDLMISIASETDTLLIDNHFTTYRQGEIEFFEFANGTKLTAAQILAGTLVAASTPGNDTILGGTGDDVLDGGAGNDTLKGAAGADTYVFGLGYGQDLIDEYSNPTGSLSDKVVFKAGVDPADLILARVGDNLVISITGTTDQLTIYRQFHFRDSASVYGQNRIENFQFADGSMWTADEIDLRVLMEQQTGGNDTITAYETDDVLDGGAGNDTLKGGKGADTYIFGLGYGQDLISENSNPSGSVADKVVFKGGIDPDDLSLARVGDDLVISIAGATDKLTIYRQFYSRDSVSVFGQDRIESFHFSNGTIWGADDIDLRVLREKQTSGNDIIVAYETDDLLDGGAGNDTLKGGKGADTYMFGIGDGQDLIDENSNPSGSLSDKVVFKAGIDADDLTLARVGDDLVISVVGTEDKLTIYRQLFSRDSASIWGHARVESFRFADGTVWTADDIDLRVLQAQQTSGHDTVLGYDTDDILNGGAGNDLLKGGKGNDNYVFGRGYGNDTIEDDGSPSHDRILFNSDIVLSDVTASRAGNDLVLTVAGTGETLRIKNQYFFDADTSSHLFGGGRIEFFVFGDGTMLSGADMNIKTLQDQATIGNDTIVGYDSADVIYGLHGNDSLSGRGGNDTLIGGNGNDVLIGGSGSDAFIFAPQFGLDTIDDFVAGASSNDIIEFDRSIFADFAAVQAAATQSGSNTIITLDASNKVTLKNVTATNLTTGDFRFVGEVGPNVVYASASGGYLSGTDGIDHFVGLGGDDTFYGAKGDDVFDGGDEAYDQVDLDGEASDWVFSRNADGSVTAVRSGWGTLSMKDIDGIYFYGSEEWSSLHSLIPGGTNVVYASAEGGYLQGSDGVDHFIGAGGHDTFYGAKGDDLFEGGSSGQDQVDLDGEAADWTFSRNADGTVTAMRDGWGTLNLKDIDSVYFYGNAQWTLLENLAPALGGAFDGTSGDDELVGTTGNDEIAGLAGNDILSGLAGDDALNGGVGDDELSGGDGNDELFGDEGADILNGSAGHDLLVGQDGDDMLDGDESDADAGNDILAAGGGNDILNGLAGNDILYGEAGNDVLNGGLGDDELYGNEDDDNLTGGADNDSFVFASDFGHDTVTDFVAGSGTDDVIEFDDAVFADLNAVLAAASQVGADTLISYDANNTITLKNVTLGNLHADDFRFV